MFTAWAGAKPRKSDSPHKAAQSDPLAERRGDFSCTGLGFRPDAQGGKTASEHQKKTARKSGGLMQVKAATRRPAIVGSRSLGTTSRCRLPGLKRSGMALVSCPVRAFPERPVPEIQSPPDHSGGLFPCRSACGAHDLILLTPQGRSRALPLRIPEYFAQGEKGALVPCFILPEILRGRRPQGGGGRAPQHPDIKANSERERAQWPRTQRRPAGCQRHQRQQREEQARAHCASS